MNKSGLTRKLTAAVLFAGVLSMCFVPAAAAEETDMCRSALTGETVPSDIGRKRPIAVMFNNIYDAIPQYGISKAGVLVEAEVEGLITRIMGILEDYEDCARIGSVRSARNYYYYYAREYNAIFCHYGEAAWARPLIALDSTIELDGEKEYGDLVYFRSEDRVSPHNAFLTYDGVQSGIEALGIDDALPDDYNRDWEFASEGEVITNDGGETANVVLPGYVYNHARFEYNAGDGLYYRYQFGDPQTDGNNDEQLAVKNIILQYCDSTGFDDNGYLWTDDVTGGTGKYITNGKAIDITWNKRISQADSSFVVNVDAANISVPVYTGDFTETLFYDTDGNPIKLNNGKTWICLIRNSASSRPLITDDYSVSSDATDY